jgi:hypothetical protein
MYMHIVHCILALYVTLCSSFIHDRICKLKFTETTVMHVHI